MIAVDRKADLLEIVGALDAAGRLPGGLDGRKQESDQDRDDRDHDQKLDQGKTPAWMVHGNTSGNGNTSRNGLPNVAKAGQGDRVSGFASVWQSTHVTGGSRTRSFASVTISGGCWVA